ncbi:MAG TPA: hypothetical protein EYH22_01195 [Candidatus Nanopusillus sp.]|nr:hypothetical protein [Candidatus Nanopusillus sp.]
MNGNACQKCQNSPWVQRAKNFINNSSNPEEQVETVKFLLQNGHCGINNRTSIDNILKHLKNKNILTQNKNNKSIRAEFQNKVLTELKRKGIVATLIYPGPQGGVFIPCNEDEIRKVAMHVLDRNIQELRNLEGTATQTEIESTISILRKIVELFKERI